MGAQPDGDWFFKLCDRASQLLASGALSPEELGQVLFGLAELHRQKRLRQEAAASSASASAVAADAADAQPAQAAAAAAAAAEAPSADGASGGGRAYMPPRWRRAEAAQELLVRVALQVTAPQLPSCPPGAISNLVVAAAELAAPEQASAFAAAAAQALAPHWASGALGKPHWARHLRRTLRQLGVTAELLPPAAPAGGAAAAPAAA